MEFRNLDKIRPLSVSRLGDFHTVSRLAFSDLLRNEFPAANALPEPERARLIDWISRDPWMRSRMAAYLRRTHTE